MAQFSQPRQPRYTAGRRRGPSRTRRTGPVGPTRARRRGPAPILIIAVVIVALVICWIFGRGCGGNREARENEKLRKYTTDVNKLIASSAAVGAQFDSLRKEAGNMSRDDLSRKMEQLTDQAKTVASEAGKVEVPEKAAGLQPLLQLSLDLRVAGLEKFKSSILDVLDKKNLDSAPATMTQGLMDLVVSDQAFQRFRGTLESKLKAANVGFEKVVDSAYVPKMDDALSAEVSVYIGELAGTDSGDEIHGVAVVGLTTSPARVDRTESGISILPYSKTFTVTITVENQGNQEEENIPVVAELTQDSGGNPQKKTQKIASLKANESKSVVFEGLTPATGAEIVNLLKITAGPVKRERKTDNNVMELEFIMRAESG